LAAEHVERVVRGDGDDVEDEQDREPTHARAVRWIQPVDEPRGQDRRGEKSERPERVFTHVS
jgi:hypothetical protein